MIHRTIRGAQRRLADGTDAFFAVRDVLRAAAQGKLAGFDRQPDSNPGSLLDERLVNPDGRHYSLLETLGLSILAGASAN